MHRAGHFRGQAHLGPVGIAQQLGLFQLQLQDLGNQGIVIQFAAGCPAHLGAVDLFAQIPALTEF